MRLAVQLLELLADMSDIGYREQEITHAGVSVVHQRYGHLQYASLAVVPEIHHFAAPDSGCRQTCPHHSLIFCRLGIWRCRTQASGHRSEQFGLRKSGDFAISRIDFDDSLLRVGNQQAFVQVSKQDVRQLALVLCGMHVADIPRRTDQAQRFSTRISLGHQCVQLEPAPATVLAQHAAFGSGADRAGDVQ